MTVKYPFPDSMDVSSSMLYTVYSQVLKLDGTLIYSNLIERWELSSIYWYQYHYWLSYWFLIYFLCEKKAQSTSAFSCTSTTVTHKWLLGKQVISKKLCFYCWERVQTFHYKFLWLHGDTHTSHFLDFLSKRERLLLAGRWPLASGAGCRNSLSLII